MLSCYILVGKGVEGKNCIVEMVPVNSCDINNGGNYTHEMVPILFNFLSFRSWRKDK